MDNYFDSTCMIIKHKYIISLIDREKECGLTYYVALSWVTKFSNLGINDIEGTSKNRLCRKMRMHPKMEKCLIEEERLCKTQQ